MYFVCKGIFPLTYEKNGVIILAFHHSLHCHAM
jgi:hypothetical protein